MDAQQVHDLYLRVVAVGREEMDFFRGVRREERGESLHRGRLRDAYLSGEVGYAGHEAHPNDVLDVDVVAEEPFLVVVDVDDTHQPVAVLAEIIEEGRVLTHGSVGIGRIVGRCLVVAEEHDDAVAHEPLEFRAAADISLFAEHKQEFSAKLQINVR